MIRVNCPICNTPFNDFMSVSVRRIFNAVLVQCPSCDFMSYDSIGWLEEAYEKAINPSDVGYVFRNVHFAEILTKLLKNKGLSDRFYLDYGSGYGMFVRLMRDRGYYFHSLDPYCESLFAPNTAGSLDKFGKYQLISAFEVFEHLADPIESLTEMLKFGDSVVFSTDLVPTPTPKASDWDYYGLEHGQHIALWTAKSLKLLAARFGHSYSNLTWISPSWHLIAPSSHPLHSPWNPPKTRWSRLLNGTPGKVEGPQSLMMHDYHCMVSLEKTKHTDTENYSSFHLDYDCISQRSY